MALLYTGAVAAMFSLLQCIFLFSLTWSLGASIDQNGREQFDLLVRELIDVGADFSSLTVFSIEFFA